MKSKKEEEEDDAKFCSLKVPMDHEDKDSKTYVVKVKKYDSGMPEEFLRWSLILNEQMKKTCIQRKLWHGREFSPSNVGGRSLEAFLNEWRAQERKKTQIKGAGSVHSATNL
jgi:hypothetical protein